MLLSVIIPTCNRNDLLRKCLDALHPSVQNFTIDNYEVIVSDDSKENIAKELIATDYTWVKWISGPKKGPAANRNNGARYANGDWLVFLDDDVIPEEQLLTSYFGGINQFKKIFVFEGKTFTENRKSRWDEIAPVNLNGGNLWSCNFTIKKDYFFEIGLFDENFSYPNLEDNDLRIRIINLKSDIFFLERASVFHPFRKIASPKNKSKYHESWLYYQQKHFGSRGLNASFMLLSSILKYKLHQLYNNKHNFKDICNIAVYTVSELFYTITNPNIWFIRR